MGVLRADGRDDALADARDDRLVRRPADQPRDVRADRHARLGEHLDPVLRHGRDLGLARGGIGTVDHLGGHAGAHGVQEVAASEVDAGGGAEVQVDAGAVGGDQRAHDAHDVAPGQKVRLEVALVDPGDARLDQVDACVDDDRRGDAPQAHRHHVEEPHAGARQDRADVEVGVAQEDEQEGEEGEREQDVQHGLDDRRAAVLQERGVRGELHRILLHLPFLRELARRLVGPGDARMPPAPRRRARCSGRVSGLPA